MPTTPTTSKDLNFGELIQLGYVTPDLDAAVEHWLGMGVGPFFDMRDVKIPEQLYRGAPTHVAMDVAFAYSGPLQVEIILQRNDAPSLYRDFLQEFPAGGLHHIAFLTQRMDAALEQAEALGTPMVQQWKDPFGSRYVYLERSAPGHPYVELLEASPMLLGVFEYMRKASLDWDGSEPRRSLM